MRHSIKFSITFSLFLSLAWAFLAQPSVYASDSLIKAKLNSNDRFDQLYARILIARSIIPDDLDSAKLLIHEAEAVANSKNLSFFAEYNNVKGLYFWYTSEYDSSIFFLMKTARLKPEPKLEQLIVEACNNGGTLLGKIGESDSSFKYLSKALEIDTKRNNIQGIAKTNFDLGIYYRRAGKYRLALQHQLASLDALEKQKDTFRIMHGLTALGSLYSSIDKDDDALKTYQQVLQFYEQGQTDFNIQVIYSNLAALYLNHLNDPINAKYYALKGLRKSKAGDDVFAYLLTNLGLVYQIEEKFDSAAFYLEKAIDVSTKYNLTYHLMGTYAFYGHVLLQQKKYDSAYAYLDKSISLSDKIDSKRWAPTAYFIKAKTDSAVGNFRMAFNHLRTGMQIKDSINNEESKIKFDELQIVYETQKKDLELDALNRQNSLNEQVIKNQTYVMLLSFVIILLFVLMVTLQSRSNKKIRLQKVDIETKNERLTELNQTKDKFFSIISHDLKGPFNSLIGLLDVMIADYDHISDDEKRNILQSVRRSSSNTYNLLVNLLDWSRAQRSKIDNVPIVVDLQMAVDHVFEVLESRADKKSHHLHNEVEPGTKVFADLNLLNSVLINLVNNAIKFTNKFGQIHVAAIREGERIAICVTDNGIGIPEDQIDKIFQIDAGFKRPGTDEETGTGLGLILVKEFVELMHGEINVKSVPKQGSTFCFSLPSAQ